MTYQEKLKDPRWQKKRLEILERDEWSCQICCDTESTLHVHHKFYEKGKDPWDYKNDMLATLCLECHEEESNTIYPVSQNLIKQVRRNFYTDNIIAISQGFNEMKMLHAEEIVAGAIGNAISDPEILQKLIDIYMERHGKSTS
jgi:hypothetical protein